MKEKRKREGATVTRRDFLRGTAYGTLGVALGLKGLGCSAKATDEAARSAGEQAGSKVVLIRSDAAVNADNEIDAKVVAEMIDTAVKTLAGEDDAAKAWGRYIRSDDTVGVKFSRCGWMKIPTEQPVIDGIAAGLSRLGVADDRILPNDSGMPLDKCTALINAPSVKVHSLTGIAASIKNYINFTDKPSAYHFDGSAKLAEAWLLPNVKDKTKLIVVDALRPYFGPGPQINPLHRWDYKGILVATDPVAVDTVCLKICQAKRNLFKGEEWPITPPPKCIAAADTDFGLGTSDLSKIEVVKLGWDKDALI